MKKPKFNIFIDQEFDKGVIVEFSQINNNFVENNFSEYKKVNNISNFIDKKYLDFENELNLGVENLLDQVPLLEKVCKALSDIIDEDWAGINEVNIIVGICPIVPRFLNNHSMIIPYNLDIKVQTHFVVHELVHFLYFKKWLNIFPNTSASTFEAPHKNWILSEILAPVIMRDSRIFSLIKTKSNLYNEWQELDKNYKFFDQFQAIYSNTKDFKDFLVTSVEKYDFLDRKIRISKMLRF